MLNGNRGNVAVWFRSDLRINDNPAFAEATKYLNSLNRLEGDGGKYKLFALFNESPYEWKCLNNWGLAKADHYYQSARVLEEKLATNWQVPMLVMKAKDTSTPSNYYESLAKSLCDLCKDNDIKIIFSNVEYEAVCSERDALVMKLLDASGILHQEFHDQCAVHPSRLQTKSGTPFKVFTQFKKCWVPWIEEHGINLATPEPIKQTINEKINFQLKKDLVPGYDLCEWTELNLKEVRRSFPPGEEAAFNLLNDFLTTKSDNYHEDRNHFHPASASKMSARLTIGTISLNQCLKAARSMNNGKLDTGKAGLVHWISELCWRDFYRSVLVNFPHVAKGHAFRPEYENLPFRAWPLNEKGISNDAKAEEEFNRWCNGQTGVPIVDAAMRQIKRGAWQNNRLRMIVAMYLTKDLLIHWRRGEEFFQRHLIDYDYASNNGGWQWSASTGTDAQPYFRIFNPLLQSEKFDPKGDYIRMYVDELVNVKAPEIHDPSVRMNKKEFDKLNYPKPLVEHYKVKEKVLALFTSVPKAESLKRKSPKNNEE